MADVVWATRAIGDLREIYAYIAHEDARAAVRVSEDLRRSAEVLSTFPYAGRPISTVTRQLVSARFPYVIQYQVIEARDSVLITRVLHSKRDRNIRPG